MLKKNYSKNGNSCRVTFKIHPETEAEKVAVLGEWNEWDADTHAMKKRKDGTFSTTVSLDAGTEYRFRYLVDGETWVNDEEADKLVLNRFGSQDCVIAL